MRALLLLVPVSILATAAGLGACGGDDTTQSPADGGIPDGGADGSTGDGGGGDAGPPLDSVLQHHNHASRDGVYVQPTFTKAAAAGMKLDTGFDGAIKGHVYAQTLFMENGPAGKTALFAFTEDNEVDALDGVTGKVLWTRTIGTPAQKSGAGCGNVSPIGITGTPIIDEASRTLYLDAAIGTASTITTHEIHALSVDDGKERAGFPVDTSKVTYKALTFTPKLQNERGALVIAGSTLYVPYGGHYGDCGDYHGWVIGVPLANPSAPVGWATDARAGGIWAPGGLASDGTSVYGATGNTMGVSTWGGGEAIIRLGAGPAFSGQTADYFAPHDWIALDNGDVDIGGSGPVLIDVPGATPSKLVVSLGKNGYVYLLDRSNLGGIAATAKGDGVYNARVASAEIINAAAAVTTASGTWVVMRSYGGSGIGCKKGSGNMIALKIAATSPPTASVEWCANGIGDTSPMITTTDGHANAVVWNVGDHLYGWDVETGDVVFDGGASATAIGTAPRRYNTAIAAKGRIYIASDDKVYAFKP